jgi:LacI family transcriptional regulator
MQPTVRDLAEAAGVSLATVDRVLNGRAGVRADTVERVHAAITRIGFVRNASAAALARGRALRLAFLLPRSEEPFHRAIEARIQEANRAFASEMVQLSIVSLDGSDPHQIARQIDRVDGGGIDGAAVMAPEAPPTRDAIAHLRERISHVVSFVSGHGDLPGMPFVGIDNHAAGATAARLMGRFLCGRPGAVLVVGETMTLRNETERRLGFDRLLQAEFARLRVLPSIETHRSADRARDVLARAMRNAPDLAGVYVPSTEARIGVEAVAALRGDRPLVVLAHERTPFTEAALRAGRVDALIAQDPGHLVRSAVRRLRASREGRAPIASQEDIRIEVLLPENL